MMKALQNIEMISIYKLEAVLPISVSKYFNQHNLESPVGVRFKIFLASINKHDLPYTTVDWIDQMSIYLCNFLWVRSANFINFCFCVNIW